MLIMLSDLPSPMWIRANHPKLPPIRHHLCQQPEFPSLSRRQLIILAVSGMRMPERPDLHIILRVQLFCHGAD